MDIIIAKMGSYLGAALAIGFGAIGAGIGEGIAAGKASESISRQPKNSGNVLRMMLIGQAVSETAGIFALVIAFILLFQNGYGITDFVAYISAGISIGVGALAPGFGSGLPAAAACEGIGRDPKTFNDLTITMLIGQAVTQTPAIFAFLVSLLLILTKSAEVSFVHIFAIIGAGIAMGFGALGPGLGSGIVAESAVKWTARRKENSKVIFRTMLLGQSVAQSTSIYSLLIAFVLILLT